ncbi:Flp pilus assembly surface protein TadF ATP/GTP-binding motif [Vibrio maritimus]|uniref:Flp pilus assembly surface protein TadF ATP/GTP-binding motif n=1 Tax=Vibrio maritimus TaxID=990268 RepID=A0A090S3L8_9VIBR|nr:Flp pilus assembly surface protein TadF ATP/GTP-binding motif [Vibrio maritimus]
MRAQLDRTSFALVNILKERTRFYGERPTLNDNDRNDMVALAARMLSRDNDSVAIKIEALHDSIVMESYTSDRFNALGCQSTSIDQKTNLVRGRRGSLLTVSSDIVRTKELVVRKFLGRLRYTYIHTHF